VREAGASDTGAPPDQGLPGFEVISSLEATTSPRLEALCKDAAYQDRMERSIAAAADESPGTQPDAPAAASPDRRAALRQQAKRDLLQNVRQTLIRTLWRNRRDLAPFVLLGSSIPGDWLPPTCSRIAEESPGLWRELQAEESDLREVEGAFQRRGDLLWPVAYRAQLAATYRLKLLEELLVTDAWNDASLRPDDVARIDGPFPPIVPPWSADERRLSPQAAALRIYEQFPLLRRPSPRGDAPTLGDAVFRRAFAGAGDIRQRLLDDVRPRLHALYEQLQRAAAAGELPALRDGADASGLTPQQKLYLLAWETFLSLELEVHTARQLPPGMSTSADIDELVAAAAEQWNRELSGAMQWACAADADLLPDIPGLAELHFSDNRSPERFRELDAYCNLPWASRWRHVESATKIAWGLGLLAGVFLPGGNVATLTAWGVAALAGSSFALDLTRELRAAWMDSALLNPSPRARWGHKYIIAYDALLALAMPLFSARLVNHVTSVSWLHYFNVPRWTALHKLNVAIGHIGGNIVGALQYWSKGINPLSRKEYWISLIAGSLGQVGFGPIVSSTTTGAFLAATAINFGIGSIIDETVQNYAFLADRARIDPRIVGFNLEWGVASCADAGGVCVPVPGPGLAEGTAWNAFQKMLFGAEPKNGALLGLSALMGLHMYVMTNFTTATRIRYLDDERLSAVDAILETRLEDFNALRKNEDVTPYQPTDDEMLTRFRALQPDEFADLQAIGRYYAELGSLHGLEQYLRTEAGGQPLPGASPQAGQPAAATEVTNDAIDAPADQPPSGDEP
jgi:hypothetical protein